MYSYPLLPTGASLLARWRPHTDTPTEQRTTALIALPGEDGRAGDGRPFVLGVCAWREQDRSWIDEATCARMSRPVFWWMDERDLLAGLPGAT